MRKSTILFFLLFSCVIATAQNGKEPVKVTDMLKIKSIGGVTISNDGNKAAFTVTVIEPDGDNKWEYKYVNQIWMVNTDGSSSPKQITGKESSSQPAFSPDGKQLAFVRLADGKPQIFLIPLDGGEASQLTKYKYGAGTPKWSPDGKQIVFSSNIGLKEMLKDSVLNPSHEIPSWPFEKPGFDKNQQLLSSSAKADPDGSIEEIRSYLENNVADKKAKVVNKLSFQDETDVSTEVRFNHFFVQSLQPGATPVDITKGFYSFNSADFTPDGKQLILSGDIDSMQNADRSLESEIFLVNNDGTHLNKLLGEEGKTFGSAKISPSGKWLAFQYGTTSFVNVPALGIMPLNG
ncbi:MAG: S9 family peptidase, partial [Bacteroidota bacterium]